MGRNTMKLSTSGDGPDQLFWQSEVYQKSYFKNVKNKEFGYYNDSSVFRYLFYHWVHRWANYFATRNVEPYKLPPVIVSDQILKYQPIFSKHVSDGIVRLDSYLTARSQSTGANVKKPYRSILLRALVLTLWKRTLFLFIALIGFNLLSMSISILVEKTLTFLGEKSLNFVKTFFLLLSILLCQIVEGLVLENINFYMNRLMCIVLYLFSISTCMHSVCHRRKYFNNINGFNTLNVCNQVLHSCSPDSECSKNPLYCQALRYQNHEITPKIFNLDFNDCFFIGSSIQAIKQITEFLTNFIYGAYLVSRHVKANLWLLYLMGVIFLVTMFVTESLNAYIYKFVLYLRDYKVTKYNDVLLSLDKIKKTYYDDIAINTITQARNNELSLLFLNMFLTFFNMTVNTCCANVSFYIIKRSFVRSVDNVSLVTDINTAAFMVTFYIFLRMISIMFLIPRAIKICGMAYASFRRLDKFFAGCSPNFYATDTRFTGSNNVASIVTEITNQIPSGVVVYYKDATFTWVNSREELLNKNYEPLLNNINFELKRGEMAVVTGSKGAGKSNFIKSMLGEMTLVGGSMAVVPLHTSMPIFYASQDIFLQHGTIRSNITFGHKFEEDVYNAVLAAVELEHDISTWEKGDLRVVSENAHSLSGGQRVRMEMARAVYAYLVFHKVNKQYNNSKCSFLMCLDASFHGLDPYVSKNIFNNLFNLKTGLLSKNDLSVVLTSSKQTLEICSRLPYLGEVPNPPIYNVKNNKLKFHSYLHDFIKVNKPVNNEDYKYFSTKTTGPCEMNYLTADMLSLCSSDATTRQGRMEVTKEKYSKSFKSYAKDELAGTKFNPYLVFMKPAVLSFLLYIFLTVSLSVLENVKMVLSTRLSDYISDNINKHKDGEFVDLSEIKTRANTSLRTITIFVAVIILVSFIATLFVTAGSFISSRKLHEYSLKSVFTHSSSVLKVKKQITQVITFLSCDLSMTDDGTGLLVSLLLFASIQTIINIVTLLYLIPISIPFVVVILASAYFGIVRKYVTSMSRINFAYFESRYHVNAVLEDAISGPSVTRSYNKLKDIETAFYEHREYYARSKFMLNFIISWGTVSLNWILSLITLTVLVVPKILDKYTKYKMKVGHFGLALSLCVAATKSFTFFSMVYSIAEVFLVSVVRFQYFIPPLKRLVFDKCINTHEEDVVNPIDKSLTSDDRKRLLKRRAIEFKADNKKFYGLRRLFYHPRLSIVDSTLFLPPEHKGVELKEVCVYTSPDLSTESMILKNITASANKSDVIGMVGRTGAGKTTLLSVLQNIVSHRDGQVLLDGTDLNKIPKVILRQIVGVLPQLPFVFRGWTVRRFLDPRRLFTDDDINQALDNCGLLKFVNGLPGGKKLNTVLLRERLGLSNYDRYAHDKRTVSDHDSEMSLSNTQLRTLSLARLVLYRHFFRVIVVDEPPEEDLAEEATSKDDLGIPIYELVKTYFQHCTTFVTAHNAHVLKSCTSVWVVHDGSIVRTCKTSDIAANESIAKIIEENFNQS
ncbi:uncharacterized protein TOT_010000104 [Theileria orientalis strain Shintoku]|uniref:ABC transporter n=1 Tax=Theileria orientalis strain Shintoku TaxID=869250 RepID=J7MGN7_THEOR|nr:uncharacterized protein TOT_010000104 [Theileria orientalis strain Shintoku]PVC50294.1 hypothetical protein MACL_00002393 [Theileria orientalis]BAM38636.1 uncharacterized protein TOT_010000104 [Theileria orientalis strain Shintoku]|eukprot:XP_009688937.1 uncharacterized protein TOT_010000104 [Theileria orientalis strain Shintoku]